jgi:hypothetical protein
MNLYEHKQTGARLMVAVLLGAAAATAAVAGQRRTPWVAVLASLLMVASAFMFTTLTVTVDRRALTFWFGPGVFRKRYDLADIAEATAVRNPWWYGWGIHRTPRGWLYNVAGPHAVELRLVDGRTLRVGTDEPKRLVDAIRRAKGG